MRLYECIFIVRQDIAAQDVHKLADKFEEMFQKFNSKVLKKEYWGLRSLAYLMKKQKKANYMRLVVNANVDAIKEFVRSCKINEDIIRYMPKKIEQFDDKPSPMMQAPSKAMPSPMINDMMS